ncbi:MAG: hypothetical protein RL680_1009 [Actinomycetota bacterium]|jgi:hypothetical protein
MALKGKPISIGATDTTIYTCPATTEASVHGLVFANNTAGAVTITLKVYIQTLGTTTTVATGISVAANSTYTWPKPIDVNAGDYIQAVASTGSAIVCLYSTYEGTATAAAVGFTPRGAWGSGSTYAVNDVVSYTNGSSYLAIQASTNQNPSTQTAYWLVLASVGATGSGDVSGPASSVDSELALFNSTTGKLIKRASLTGLVKATSGVASAATAGTDYVAPAGALGTPSSGTLTNCTADGTNGVGYLNVPINSQSAAYTAVIGDSGKAILHPSTDANARTFTIPANASVAYPLGTAITFINMTSQVVTIAITSDTMYLAGLGTTGSRSLAQYGMATAVKMTSTTWIISGNGVT